MSIADFIEVLFVTVLIALVAGMLGWDLDRFDAISVALLFFIAHKVARATPK